VAACAGAVALSTAELWRPPWGLRVRLAEVLLRGVFDCLDEGSYVADSEPLLAALQGDVWPRLGACLAPPFFAFFCSFLFWARFGRRRRPMNRTPAPPTFYPQHLSSHF
jgi:hypothetical protein